jgi:hypothetical protein
VNTCANCKHLGEAIIDWDEILCEFGPCGYYKCDFVQHDLAGERRRKKLDFAYVEDGDGYYAALCVRGDFGCNQWEAHATDKAPS